MLITSLREIVEGVAYEEWGRKREPNKKSIVDILKWLKSNGMIRIESNAYGTVIWIENYKKYNPNEGGEVTDKKGKKVTQPKRAPERSAPAVSPEAVKLAALLVEKIQVNNQHHRYLVPEKRERTMADWAIDIDKLLRLDRQDYETVGKVIIWCQKHKFWKMNIQSGRTLREKWDRLYLQMKEAGPVKGEVPPPDNVGSMFAYDKMKEMEKKYR